MELSIQGRPKNVSKKIIRKGIGFFSQKLMTPRLLSSLFLKIKFADYVEGANAKCSYGNESPLPKNFTIDVLNNLPKKTTLLSIAHELVHVKQYARGELFQYACRKDQWRWKDEIHDIDIDDDEYWFAPWEIEAYGYEVGLVLMFTRKMRKEGTPIFGIKGEKITF